MIAKLCGWIMGRPPIKGEILESKEFALERLSAGVYTTSGQIFGSMLVRLEQCKSCLAYCAIPSDGGIFPYLMEYNWSTQVKRSGWKILSKNFSQEFRGWVCTECECRMDARICKNCKKEVCGGRE